MCSFSVENGRQPRGERRIFPSDVILNAGSFREEIASSLFSLYTFGDCESHEDRYQPKAQELLASNIIQFPHVDG